MLQLHAPSLSTGLAHRSPTLGVRISEIVNTMSAYNALAAGLMPKAKGAASTGDQPGTGMGQVVAVEQVDPSTLDSRASEQDTVEISPEYYGGQWEQAESESEDDSIGAIVESFIRQRQTYAFTLPSIGGMTSPVSVTWEVEEAYRVIELVPRSRLDVQA